MASRKEQLAQRRAQQAAERAAAERRRRLWIGGGGAVAVLVLAGVTAAILLSGGGSNTAASKGGFAAATIPPSKMTNLTAAAKAAGCQLRTYPDYGNAHTTGSVTYKTNPPTSGDHNPEPAADGAYPPGAAPAVAQSVHSLEHGRVEIQWRSGLPKRQINQLHALFNERDGYHALLFENQTQMPYPVAATAWRQALTCPRFTPVVFDAIRAFRATYTDKGPELVP